MQTLAAPAAHPGAVGAVAFHPDPHLLYYSTGAAVHGVDLRTLHPLHTITFNADEVSLGGQGTMANGFELNIPDRPLAVFSLLAAPG